MAFHLQKSSIVSPKLKRKTLVELFMSQINFRSTNFVDLNQDIK